MRRHCGGGVTDNRGCSQPCHGLSTFDRIRMSRLAEVFGSKSNDGRSGRQIQRPTRSGAIQETAHCSYFDRSLWNGILAQDWPFPRRSVTAAAIRVELESAKGRSDRKRIKILCNESSCKNSNQAQGVVEIQFPDLILESSKSLDATYRI